MQKILDDYEEESTYVVKEYPTFQITEEMRKLAKKNKYEEVGKLRGNPDYILPTSRFFQGNGKNQTQNVIGNLGDMTFQLYLRKRAIQFTRDGLYLHQGDCFDYKIDEKLYDVKTGQMKENGTIYDLPPNYQFFIAEQQINKEIDYYIHIQVNSELTKAYLIGYISREDALKNPIEQRENMCNPAVCIPFSQLKPVGELFNSEIG